MIITISGFPVGSVVKNPSANAGDAGLIPGSGIFPEEGNGNPLRYSCLGNSMDRGAWQEDRGAMWLQKNQWLTHIKIVLLAFHGQSQSDLMSPVNFMIWECLCNNFCNNYNVNKNHMFARFLPSMWNHILALNMLWRTKNVYYDSQQPSKMQS